MEIKIKYKDNFIWYKVESHVECDFYQGQVDLIRRYTLLVFKNEKAQMWIKTSKQRTAYSKFVYKISKGEVDLR